MIDGLEAITFDFGNTLVLFPGSPMASELRATADRAAEVIGCSPEPFLDAWAEERQRQFDEDVPEGREADIDVRVGRIIARLRGLPVPPPGRRWDHAAVGAVAHRDEVSEILDAYADAFVARTPVPPEIGPMLERLSRRYRLGLISNWPLSLSIERFLAAAGWRRHLTSVVVSHRVGAIKPRGEIFEVAAAELGVASGPAILHVGDDLGADVLGAQQLGWRTAWVRLKPADSPLPVAPPAPDARPTLTIDSVLGLEAALAELPPVAGK
jgi:HAD superfamily hydrolase (TIGR01509 family)